MKSSHAPPSSGDTFTCEICSGRFPQKRALENHFCNQEVPKGPLIDYFLYENDGMFFLILQFYANFQFDNFFNYIDRKVERNF